MSGTKFWDVSTSCKVHLSVSVHLSISPSVMNISWNSCQMVKNDWIWLSKVLNEASQQSGFNGVHNFCVTNPLVVKIAIQKIIDYIF